METKYKIALGIGVIVIVIAMAMFVQSAPSKNDAFAKCLTEKGAKFYGAFWCPHCKEQKDIIGSAMKYVNYVECSTPDGNGQLQVCTDAGIETYPTWEFSDKSRVTGVMELRELSASTGCLLPK